MVKNLLFLINLLHKWLKLLNRSLNGSQMVAFTFAMLILCGSLLLMLPMASADGSSMRFIDALFTATSTSCVTGLVVVDRKSTRLNSSHPSSSRMPSSA